MIAGIEDDYWECTLECHDHLMTSRLCPYCKVTSDMAPVWAATETSTNTSGYAIYKNRVVCMCANCRELSTAIIFPMAEPLTTSSESRDIRAALALSSVVWTPQSAPAPLFPRVPSHVARCATEAHMAHGIGAEIASILMTRTTIEATAKSQDVTDGSLMAKIKEMSDRNIIRPATLSLADVIRVLGNDMAHGDVEALPTSEDASDALKLMDMILEEVFQATAIADEILARRAVRTGKDLPQTP